MDGQSDHLERVYELDLHGRKLVAMEGLKKYKHLRILDLSCNGLCRIPGLSSNCSLKELKLYDNEIGEVEGMERLTELQNLQLQHNKIHSIGRGLAGQRKLKVLRLDHNLLQQVTPPELASCSQLTHVDLSHNHLMSVEGLGALHSLEELRLSSNQLIDLPNLASCSKLQVLNVSCNPLGPSSLLPLTGTGLKELYVEGVHLKDLTALPLLRFLEELHAAHNGLRVLQGVCSVCPSLELLDVRSNLLNSTEDLQPLVHLSSLTDLLLEANPLCLLNSYRSEVRSLLPSLEVIDGVTSHGGSAPAMRPVTSSGRGPSLRQVEHQLREVELELETCQKGIASRFEDLQATVSTCSNHHGPALGPNSDLMDGRPASQFGSRARLQDALTFAKEHFRNPPRSSS